MHTYAHTCLLTRVHERITKTSGAHRPARGPHPARDELSSGPPCPAGKVTILGFALQKMENARRKPSWILFRLSGLNIQDETEVLPTARRLRTFYSFRYFPVTYVCNKPGHRYTALHVFRMSEPLIVIFCYFKDCGQCRQHTQVYADSFVVVPMDYIFVTRYHYRNLLIFSHLMQCMFLSETKLFWPLIRLSTCHI